jgi:hypothetical protein
MENKSAVLVLSLAPGFAFGMDEKLQWVDLKNSENINLFDVVNLDNMQKLRISNRDVLLSKKFQELTLNDFNSDDNSPALVNISDLKIYKFGEVCKCDFMCGNAQYSEFDMCDSGFFIDGYSTSSAVVVIKPNARKITAIATRKNDMHCVNVSDSNGIPTGKGSEKMSERMEKIQARMAQIFDAANEYNNLKSELVALVKENNGDLKHTYESQFFKVIYNPPGIRRTIDSDKLKSAGLYELYIKETKSSPSVRIVKV